MMIAFFQTMFMFGHRPWKVADPKARDHMGVGAFNLIRRRVYESIGTYKTLRMEVLDDMKLGKVVKNSGFAQRNVFGADLISIRWANGAMGVVNNLTQKLFCGVVVRVAENDRLGVWVGISKPDAISRGLAGAWVGAFALCDCSGIDLCDLCWNEFAVRGSGILFSAASRKRDAVYVHPAAIDGTCSVEQRNYLARHEVSAGRVEKGDGVMA